MNNKTIYFFIFTIAAFLKSNGQNFINGDFEINTAGSNKINQTNAQYNSYMPNSFAFGSWNGGGPGGGDMDIITTASYCGLPQHGNWYVALTSGGTDAISLTLSSSLIAGNTYTLSFYDRSCSPYTPGSPIKIGVSNINNSFGSLVYTAPSPIFNGGWTQRTFSFISPINAAFITVTCDSVVSGGPWTQVDNFTFDQSSSLETIDPDNYFEIFPNPASNLLNIKTNLNPTCQFNIFNSLGQIVLQGDLQSNQSTISIYNLANGIYSIVLSAGSNKERHFFIVEKQSSR